MSIRTLFILALTAVISVALVACGGANASSSAEVISNTAETAQIQPATVGLVGPSAAATESVQVQQVPENPVGETARNTTTLDADEIVAAYERVLGNIFESVLPSVVQVKVVKTVTQQQGFRFRQVPEGFAVPGEGSGFVWSDQGHVVTNHHVIEGADRVTVVFADGSEFETIVLGSDPDADLAVLSIDVPAEMLRPIGLGDSSQLNVGQLVIAIGSPFG